MTLNPVCESRAASKWPRGVRIGMFVLHGKTIDLHEAKLSKSNTIFLSSETLQAPKSATHFVQCWRKNQQQPVQILQEVKQILSSSSAKSTGSQRMNSGNVLSLLPLLF